jgi:hypothetical protein
VTWYHYALAKCPLVEVANAPASTVPASTEPAASSASASGLPFTAAKILAATTASPHAHFIILIVVFAMPVIVLAVMRLVWEMTTVPKFPTHHAFAAPAHAVSFSSATTTSARPCIGAYGKRSDNGGDP